MKECRKCGAEKDDAEFYARHTKCKDCTKTDVRVNRRANSSYYRAYDRARGNRQPPEYLKRYRQLNPEKYKAHNAVNNAIRDGKLFKQPCFFCGESRVTAHHPDYSKPLDVVWMCHLCHRRLHAYEEKAEQIKALNA